MIPHLRKSFNARFTSDQYRTFLGRMDERSGTHIDFRISETPCFFPGALLETMGRYGEELIGQLVNNPEYRAISEASIPAEFNVPNEDHRPLFVQVDFGLVRNAAGSLEPKLVEIQGFPSLYAYQVLLCQQYKEAFGLDSDLKFLLSGLNVDSYNSLLCKAIVGDHDPENVILMEIDPLGQKTLCDFLLTQKICGIPIVNITDVEKDGSRLYYKRGASRVPIRRIYNRAIVDELIRKGKRLSFSFRDDLEVEWAGHPNWFFRMSKFSIPNLNHPCVPRTWFLDRLGGIPSDLENYVLKPLFSFAGLGVVVGPTIADIEKIPPEKRSEYILQEKMSFVPLIETPHGPTKAEVRVAYVWLERLLPVILIIRMGRGKLMGVDHNWNMEWVGSSAGFYS